MGLGVRTGVAACAASFVGMFAPGAAQAQASLNCDAEIAPNANVRLDAPGLWSDGEKWSLGHMPTANEDACVDGTGVVLDVDVTTRSLRLTAGTKLVLTASSPTITVTGTLAGGDDSSLAAQPEEAMEIHLRDGARIEGVTLASAFLTLNVEGDDVRIGDVRATADMLRIEPRLGTDAATLRAAGRFDASTVLVEHGVTLRIDSCESNGHGTSWLANHDSMVTFGDVDCVDVPAGFERTIAAETYDDRLRDASIVFDFDDTLDAGGMLALRGWLGIPAGRRIVDGPTRLIGEESEFGIRAAGVGTATLVDLFVGDPPPSDGATLRSLGAGAGESLALENPNVSGVRYAFVQAGGRVATTTPIAFDLVHGAGTVAGSGSILTAMACGGTLAITGTFTIAQTMTCGGPSDLVTATTPHVPTTSTPTPPKTPDPPSDQERVIRTGTARADRIVGGPLADVLRGGAGNDVLIGGAGNDRIDCGRGPRDRVQAGTGNDTITCRDGRRGSVVDCGPGRDRVVADRSDVVRRCEVVLRR